MQHTGHSCAPRRHDEVRSRRDVEETPHDHCETGENHPRRRTEFLNRMAV